MIKTSSTDRIPQLDGLRGIAILLVVVWHYFVVILELDTAPPVLNWLARSLSLSWSGVDLFFVLSGFLIGGILLDNKNGRHYFKAFYIRRVCRIFPLYFTWLLIFLIALYTIPPTSMLAGLFDNPLPFWVYLTFTQNIAMSYERLLGVEWLAVTWSLAIEEQFYLFLPGLIHVTNTRKLPYILLAFILAAPLIRAYTVTVHPQLIFGAWLLMPSRMDSLLLGVLCAWAIRQPTLRQFLTTYIRFLYYLLIILFSGTAAFTYISPPNTLSLGMLYIGYTWLALFYANILLIILLKPAGIFSRVMKTPSLRHLGYIAYGVYLFHQVFNYHLHILLLKQSPQFQTVWDVLVTLLAFSLTVIIASISWEFFEKRFIKLGHSFRYR
jgi:peptidoglycan/LPS O-acetylase OafA/YrhL